MFEFLSFNRPPDNKHVLSLVESIRDFRFIDPLTIAYTDCVDGELKYWVLDGQHGLLAAEIAKETVYYIIVHVRTLEELVRMIAVLNTKRKPWKLADFLRAWLALKIPVYQKISAWMGKLPINAILQAFSKKERNTASEEFRAGKFREDGSIDAELILGYLVELKKYTPNTTVVITGLLWFLIDNVGDGKNSAYDHRKMISVLKSRGQTTFLADDDSTSVKKKIKLLYEA